MRGQEVSFLLSFCTILMIVIADAGVRVMRGAITIAIADVFATLA